MTDGAAAAGVGGRAAYRRDGRLVAREAFYAAACDPALSCVVEACAGAGKTWMLVSRILRALLDGARPQEILAITFTRKAAGEMRERLADWLAHYASPATPDDELAQALRERGLDAAAARLAVPSLRALHGRVLESGRPVEIRTFHAWFAQLLGAAPFELLGALGLRPDLTLIEDEAEHAGELFRRFHAAVARDPALEADYRGLIERHGRHDARRWLETAWTRRIELVLADEAGVLEGSLDPARPAPAVGAAHPVEELRGAGWRARLLALARALGGGRTDTARKAAEQLLGALEAAATDGGADAAAVLHRAVRRALLTRAGTPRKHLGAAALLDEVCGELQRLADDIAQHEAWVEHAAMVRLSRTLLDEYAAYKRRGGLADMADLERCALALLGDPLLAGWVQERLDLRVRHLLIDEFQDTSPLQWQALHGWLEGYAGAGGGASGQQPPGVFIVGDPKQSVYRFRRAEPRVFDAARRFVRDGLGGVALACDHTRRNAPSVVDVVNRVFEAARDGGEYEGFRAHTTEVDAHDGEPALLVLPGVARPPPAGRDAAAADAEPVWRDTLTTPRHEPEQVLREQEAARVADAVAGRLADGRLRAGEVFVLSRKRESLRLVERALQARGIACSSVGEQALMDAPEVRDLVAVLDAVVSPRHRLALAQALKSPLFGATDDDLLRLAEAAADDGDWWRALLRLGRERAGGGAVLARAARLLLRWRGDSARLPPHDLLDRIVAEGDAMRRYAAAVPPARRASALAAIEALLAQALLLDGGRYATPYGFVRALRRHAVKATLPAVPDAVQLLTVHGAKGLEARLVFLMDADPERMPGERLSLLVDWPVGSAAPLRCAFIGSEAACPRSLQPLLDAENAARRRESLNLLYVAMTRAREGIVVSHTVPHRPGEGTSWRARLEPLALPWPMPARAMPPEPAGRAAEPAAAGAPPFLLRELPAWRPTSSERASAAVPRGGGSGAADAAPCRIDPAAAGLGAAVRRVLDWATQAAEGAAAVTAAGRLAALAVAAAGEHGADPDEVLHRAQAVLRSLACARFFAAAAAPHWSANAVTLADAGGEPLVVDRLVCLPAPQSPSGRVWWVLAYRLHADASSPADDEASARLLRCRAALAVLQPGEPAHCAFVTGDGAVTEVEVGAMPQPDAVTQAAVTQADF